jgi:hypothetical protein
VWPATRSARKMVATRWRATTAAATETPAGGGRSARGELGVQGGVASLEPIRAARREVSPVVGGGEPSAAPPLGKGLGLGTNGAEPRLDELVGVSAGVA